VCDNKWHFIIGTVTLGNQSKLYIDGQFQSVSTQTLDISSYPLEFGRYLQSNGYAYKGFLDDVRIYNRALSAGEIQYLYTKTQGRYK